MGQGKRTFFERNLLHIMICFAVGIVAIYLARPLYDPDFYWHLKTGQWIWQNGMLPFQDPFGIQPLPEPTPRTEFMLTSYWLLQVILYGFYSLGGLYGIVLFRWLITFIFLLIIMSWVTVRNSSVVTVLAIGAILLLEYYFIERPQFVSFVYFAAELVIILRFLILDSCRTLLKTLLPLALVMVVWSNMHGGFLVGQALLAFCIFSEGLKFCHRSLAPLSPRDYSVFCGAAVTALAASFINPNALNAIKYLPIILDASHYSHAGILEQLSLYGYFMETHDYTVLVYLVSIAATMGVLLVSKQRHNITVAGVLIGTAAMGSLHMRLLPFFIVAAMLFVMKFFATESSSRNGTIILFVMFVVTTAYCIQDEFQRVAESARSGLVPAQQFPVKAADFIAANHIPGNLFTTVNWGGYMIWRMSSANKIFHDGRMLNVQRAWEYNNSRIVAANQRPYWKGLLKMYHIQVVVLPLYEDSGEPFLLARSMVADNEWLTAYYAENEVVLVRK